MPGKLVFINHGTQPVNVPDDATIEEIRQIPGYEDAIEDSTSRFNDQDLIAERAAQPTDPNAGRNLPGALRETAELLPMMAGGAMIPFTGGMSMPAAMLAMGGASATGSLGRSAILGEDLGTTARRAATEGVVGAVGEGGGRLVAGPALAAGRSIGRRFLDPNLTRQVPGAVDTLLSERILRNPFTSPGGALASRVGQLEGRAGAAVADPAVGARPVPVIDYGRNMPITRATRAAREGRIANAGDIAQANRVIGSAIDNPSAGRVLDPTTGRVVGRRADSVVPAAAEEAHRAAQTGARSTAGAVERSLAQDAYNAAATTVPEAGDELRRLSNLVPVRQGITGGRAAIIDPRLTDLLSRTTGTAINRGGGTLADLLAALGRSRGGQGAVGDLTREAIIRLLEPSHQSAISRGRPTPSH